MAHAFHHGSGQYTDRPAQRGPFLSSGVNPTVSEFHYQEYQKIAGSMPRIQSVRHAGSSRHVAGYAEIFCRTAILDASGSQGQGEGPSQKVMDNGFFRCDLVGIAADGRKVFGVVSDKGDPGNRATVKFLCESALCLALNADRLPGGLQRGSVSHRQRDWVMFWSSACARRACGLRR